MAASALFFVASLPLAGAVLDGRIVYKSCILGDETFNVTVFLPPDSAQEVAYYRSSRFDWSSQIGNVRIGPHVLFGDNFWRSDEGQPHDPTNPEAAVGLASEFGCGEMGAVCGAGPLNYAAGSQNGVLGYEEAQVGEPFLKIGVGKLLKPVEGFYSIMQRYVFYEHPSWGVIVTSPNTVEMVQEVSLNERWGYRLQTSIAVEGTRLQIETTLSNIGSSSFSTPHYSHNFLSVDRSPIAPGWNVSLVPDPAARFEPGNGTWTVPIDGYLSFVGDTIQVTKEVPVGAKMKAVFVGERNAVAKNVWSAQHGDLKVESIQEGSSPMLYQYNLYVERATFSPEPTQLIVLGPGESTTWTRSLTFSFSIARSNLRGNS